MALWVTEYAGAAFISGRIPGAIPQEPSLRTTVVSSGGTVSTITLSSGTRMVSIISDAPAWLLAGSSTGVTVVTSTNAGKVSINTPDYRGVFPYQKLSAMST